VRRSAQSTHDLFRLQGCGSAGGTHLAACEDSMTLLMENAVDLSVQLAEDGSDQTILEMVDVLGIAHTAPDSWVLGDGVDIYDTGITNLVAAQGSLNDSLIAVVLVGMALGIDTQVVVGGYGGSSEFISAVLRQEVDLTSISLQTALSRTDGNEAYVVLVVSDSPDSDAPDVPYLAGEGGVAQARAAGLSDEVMEQRRHFAELAVALSGTIRGMYISNAVSEATRDCRREAMTESLLSDELSQMMAELDRPLAPLTGDAALPARRR